MNDEKTPSEPTDLASASDEALTYETIARAFKVIDIAQAIQVQVRPDASVNEACGLVIGEPDDEQPRCEFCLVRDGRRIIGYAHLLDDLSVNSEAPVRSVANLVTPEMLVPAELPIIDLIPLFRRECFFLVLSRNDVTHVVTFQDLDKLAVKSSVFSLILELEELLNSAIHDAGAETLLSYLPPGRRDKARLLCKQKYEGKDFGPEQELHCTTFIDKKTMALAHEAVRKRLPFKSRREADRFFKKVEDTRNQIAHGESMLAKLATPEEFDDLISSIRRVLASLR
jgi:hypothetical protein